MHHPSIPLSMKTKEKTGQFTQSELVAAALSIDPFEQFEKWYQEAEKSGNKQPNAFSLTTVSAEGIPSIRTVYLKSYDRNGFVFYTNYESKKAQEIAENANVAILFPWLNMERQVQIRGKAEKVSLKESMAYFASRPRGSRLGAWVSQQSSVISSRKVLQMQLETIKRKFKNGEVPLPSFWGGYRIVPESFEFWQGREHRLHDRFYYTSAEGSEWKIERLAP